MLSSKLIAACLLGPLLAVAFFFSGYLIHSAPSAPAPDYKGTALAQITSAAVSNGITLSEEKFLGQKPLADGSVKAWVRVRVGQSDPILLRVTMLKQFVWVARVCTENTGVSSTNDCGTRNVRP